MPLSSSIIPKTKKFLLVSLGAGLISSFFGGFEYFSNKNAAFANQGFLEMQWDDTGNYRKLRYYQSTSTRQDRSTYYLFLRPGDRKTAILKMTIKVPDYWDSKLTPQKLVLCKVQIGGFRARTKCLEKLPTVFEINEDQTSIDVFPQTPIPLNKFTYALRMKIFNPRRQGMFQLQALSQSPGDLPISKYVGTWNITIQN